MGNIGEDRKYELKKALACFWEIQISCYDYKELEGFIEDQHITADDITYMKTLEPQVTFEEKEKKRR